MLFEEKHSSLYSAAGLLGASLVIHGALFVPLRPVLIPAQNEMIRFEKAAELRQKERLSLEFVEAPSKAKPQKPRKPTRKISDRDAVNQDLIKNKPATDSTPRVKTPGVSDQLAQNQGSAVQPASVLSKPAPAIKPVVAEPEEKPLAEKQAAPGEDILSRPAPAENRPEEAKTEPRKEAEAKPESMPQPPIQGAPGMDRIIAQETAKTKSGGAQMYGFTSFAATGSGMGVYMKSLKEKIWFKWYPYLAFNYPQDYRGADAIVRVLLDKKGEVKEIGVLESRGSELFAAFCMDAIKKASGFGALPEEILALLGKEDLELKFRFRYY
jgi:outer membrane biosynthesis protein TonB